MFYNEQRKEEKLRKNKGEFKMGIKKIKLFFDHFTPSPRKAIKPQ